MSFYENIQSIEEAILIGEAATLFNHISPKLLPISDNIVTVEDRLCINEMNKVVLEKLESALSLDHTNFYILHTLFLNCSSGYKFLLNNELSENEVEVKFYRLKLIDYSYILLDHPSVPEQFKVFRSDYYFELAYIFSVYRNYPAAHKYSKLAYEHCLRSSEHIKLSSYKDLYLQLRIDFAALPPLRFAVGDEVEFLHERETGSEWRQGKVVELYYRERDFEVLFNAPYRLQLRQSEPHVYAWVKADLDHYVRKKGVKSIGDTRYQTRLDDKVVYLARIYCTKEFIHDIYHTLTEDHDFVEMLVSVWQIELSVRMLLFHRVLVMYRQPLVRTDSGYHLPSTEEIIAGIKAYFDPALLSDHADVSIVDEESELLLIRAFVLESFQGKPHTNSTGATQSLGVQPNLLRSSLSCSMLIEPDSPGSPSGLLDLDGNFAVPSELSDAISKVSTTQELRSLQPKADGSAKLSQYLHAWIDLHKCLENPRAGPACECPFVYFFVKICLDHGFGVPKLALAVYDRMNMQLSREFIRCANPTCEHNKLDKSTGKVKFKQCSRCKATIYCSRECQTAHYPDHKRLCREHLTG